MAGYRDRVCLARIISGENREIPGLPRTGARMVRSTPVRFEVIWPPRSGSGSTHRSGALKLTIAPRVSSGGQNFEDRKVAQSVEHLTHHQTVGGSIPSFSSWETRQRVAVQIRFYCCALGITPAGVGGSGASAPDLPVTRTVPAVSRGGNRAKAPLGQPNGVGPEPFRPAWEARPAVAGSGSVARPGAGGDFPNPHPRHSPTVGSWSP